TEASRGRLLAPYLRRGLVYSDAHGRASRDFGHGASGVVLGDESGCVLARTGHPDTLGELG
ncbi:hypothetical protein, partial [Klebsiella pneumoniae]